MINAINPSQIFQNIPSDGPVIVAVSGGSDSIALLHLASVWSRLKDVDLKVVTVDHGLRPEAAAEAGFVAGVSESLNLPHVTLAWDGVKPNSGISEAARNARYMLMEEFASDIGASAILVGHTSDDQAETIWMRNSRDGGNSQWRGLSGMARRTVLPSGLLLVRPLLNASRSELREYLGSVGQSWIEDPSNYDRSYERVRARKSLQSSEIGREAICRFGSLLGRQRKLVADKASELLQEQLIVQDGPVYLVSKNIFENADRNLAVLISQILIAFAGGRQHFVPFDLAHSITELEVGSRMSAGYAIAEHHKSGFRFFREKRFLPTIHINPFSSEVWDNRLLIENGTDRPIVCSAPGQNVVADLENELQTKFSVKPRSVLPTTPLISSSAGKTCLPFIKDVNQMDGIRFTLKVPAIESFCSAYDFALLDLVETVKIQLNHPSILPG